MKYFTPELYVRGQSRDDDVVGEVERLWEEAGERYVSALEQIQADLPPGPRYLLDNFYLHDAVICAMGRQDERFIIVLQVDTPPHELLVLTYRLIGEPGIDEAALPPEHRSPNGRVEWMYDEVDLERGTVPVSTQTILFSNGWEVRLRFRDVEVMPADPLLPVPRAGPTTRRGIVEVKG
jgi:hypothetical protein